LGALEVWEGRRGQAYEHLRIVSTAIGGFPPWLVNDSHPQGHKAVMAMFDAAIALAEKEERECGQ
jgi:hypothetical protein